MVMQVYIHKVEHVSKLHATLSYLDSCNDQITWGNGDSLDRERVRDVMNSLYD